MPDHQLAQLNIALARGPASRAGSRTDPGHKVLWPRLTSTLAATCALALTLWLPGVAVAARWTIAAAPANSATALDSVSCSAPDACTAVGSRARGTFAVRSTTTDWAVESSSNPAGTAPKLTAVACPSSRECVAVGTDGGQAQPYAGFAEMWNGTNWGLQPIAGNGVDTAVTLGSVTCPSAGFCLAAGSITPGVGEPMSAVQDTLTESWTGSGWVRQRAGPLSPAQAIGNAPFNELTGISCSSSTACTAVGFASNNGPPCRHCGNLALGFDGHRWSYERPSQRATPAAVSCPTTTVCASVGGDIAEIWNGAVWTPTRLAGLHLHAVSCVTATSRCVAVGTGHGGTLAVERWTGHSWSPQSAPVPAGAQAIRVHGVSCPTPAWCVLVGSYRASGTTRALIETYS